MLSVHADDGKKKHSGRKACNIGTYVYVNSCYLESLLTPCCPPAGP